jgi:predicted GIY-YIG superfamily endonuclease
MKAIHHTTAKENNLTYKVYALLEPDGKVYVGRTTMLRSRMYQHANKRKTTINSLTYRAIELNNELQARKIEAFLIEEFYDILTNKNFVNIGVRRSEKCVKDFKASTFFNSVMTYAQRMSNILKHAKGKNNRIGKLVANHVPEWTVIEARGPALKRGRKPSLCGPAKPKRRKKFTPYKNHAYSRKKIMTNSNSDFMTQLIALRERLVKP